MPHVVTYPVGDDVDCYCNTFASWKSILRLFAQVPPWLGGSTATVSFFFSFFFSLLFSFPLLFGGKPLSFFFLFVYIVWIACLRGITGPERGRPDLDSLDVAGGSLDGLVDVERQTAVTLWAICGAPLYTGNDLTTLSDFGVALLTHPTILAINSHPVPAVPLTRTQKTSALYRDRTIQPRCQQHCQQHTRWCSNSSVGCRLQ